ncbi:MAG: nucleotidyltransferase domain-containing protein [archaeon]
MGTLTKNELNILNLFRKDIFFKASIREIMKRIDSKSYQRVYEAIASLEKNHILSSEKIGNTNQICLKMSRNTLLNLSFLDEQENENIPNAQKIIAFKEITDYLIIASGSYAKGHANKKSDLDLVIIIPDKEDVVHIQKLVENLTMLFVPEVHLYVFKKKDFIEMLTEKKENYGKEIFKNHVILKNAQIYYELLTEAIENGFKG